MKNLLLASFVFFLFAGCNIKMDKTELETEKFNVHKVLAEYFNAIEDRNWEKLKSLSTDDMILVEHGLLWNNDSLINALEKYWHGYEISYSFDFIKTHVDGSSAWTIYRNHGIAKKGDQEMHFHWIESVIFTKENGEWKIIEAQSTREGEPKVIETSRD